MEYKFRYKLNRDKKSFINWYREALTRILLFFYRNKYFIKLHLNKNLLIRGIADVDDKRYKNHLLNKLNEDASIKPYVYSYTDVVSFEEFNIFSSNLLSMINLVKESNKFSRIDKVEESILSIQSNYKSIKWGKIHHFNLKPNKKYDLIESISINYIKGSLSTFLIEYRIRTSELFNDLYKSSLLENSIEQHTIHVNNIFEIIKNGKITNSVRSNIISSKNYLKKLNQEIGFQLKLLLQDNQIPGLFVNIKMDTLLPGIFVYEINPNDLRNNYSQYCTQLDINNIGNYINGKPVEVFVNLPNHEKVLDNTLNINLFFSSEFQDNKSDSFQSQINSIWYQSDLFIQSIMPIWFVINVNWFSQSKIINYNRDIFNYIIKNNDNLFLTKAISISQKLLNDIYVFKRIKKDYFTDSFKYFMYQNLPFKLLNDLFKTKFEEDIEQRMLETTLDIESEYKLLEDQFKQISNEKVISSNTRISKWVLIFSFVGIVYAPNFSYFNNLIKTFFSNLFCS